MKTKFFLTGLVMAAVVFVSCGRCNQSKASLDKEETPKASVMPVRDNKLTINFDLYNISEEHIAFSSHGTPATEPLAGDTRGTRGTDDMFGSDHLDHYRTLFVKEDGGLTVGYVVKTTRGITLQTEKSFYFYNDLCLKQRTHSLYNIIGMVKNDGSLIPMKIMIDGKDNQIMRECKGDETLTFVPLRGNDKEMQYTVQELKDYCNKHGLTIDAVPYLKFSD